MFQNDLAKFQTLSLEQKIDEVLHILSFLEGSHPIFLQIRETIENKLYTPEYIDLVYTRILTYTEKIIQQRPSPVQMHQQDLYQTLQHIREMEQNDPDKKDADVRLEKSLSGIS